MKLFISASRIADAARSAARAVHANHGRRKPILNCCRLTAGSNLSIYGTDLDTGITAIADCDVIEPGEAVVDAHRLADIAGKLNGDVHLEVKAGDLVVKCGRSRFTLAMMSVEDYPPPLAVEDGTPTIDLTAADVMAMW